MEAARQLCIFNRKGIEAYMDYLKIFRARCYGWTSIKQDLEKCHQEVENDKNLKNKNGDTIELCMKELFSREGVDRDSTFYKELMINQIKEEQFYEVSPSLKINNKILRVGS